MMWVAWIEGLGSSAVGWRLKKHFWNVVSAQLLKLPAHADSRKARYELRQMYFKGGTIIVFPGSAEDGIFAWNRWIVNRSLLEAPQSKNGLKQYIFCSDGLSALLFTIKIHLPIILLVGQADCASLWCNQVSPVRCFGAVATEPWLVNFLAGPRHPLQERETA